MDTFPAVSNSLFVLVCSDIPTGLSEWETHTISKEGKLSISC